MLKCITACILLGLITGCTPIPHRPSVPEPVPTTCEQEYNEFDYIATTMDKKQKQLIDQYKVGMIAPVMLYGIAYAVSSDVREYQHNADELAEDIQKDYVTVKQKASIYKDCYTKQEVGNK